MSEPAVSVLITAYQVTPYIAEAVESVLGQTRQDQEIVLVNDGCPDTPGLENALRPYWSHIRYFRQDNGGPSAARNTALEHARGKYVALLDGDDQWKPHYIESQLGAMEADPSIDLLYPNLVIFGGTREDGRFCRPPSEQQGPVTLEALFEESKTVTSVAMIKRDLVKRVGGWDTSIGHSEDFGLWVRIAASGARMVYNPEVLANYRIRAGSQSRNTASMYSGRIHVLEKSLRELPLTDAQRELARRRIQIAIANRHFVEGKAAFAQGDLESARRHFEQANPLLRNWKVSAILKALKITPHGTHKAVRLLQYFGLGSE